MNSNPQPTPGPWKSTTSYGAHTDEPWMIWSEPRDRAIAQCYRISESGEDNASEQSANARLIAAAPDLLAACKAALKALEPEQGEWNDIRNQLRQTIAKAGYK